MAAVSPRFYSSQKRYTRINTLYVTVHPRKKKKDRGGYQETLEDYSPSESERMLPASSPKPACVGIESERYS